MPFSKNYTLKICVSDDYEEKFFKNIHKFNLNNNGYFSNSFLWNLRIAIDKLFFKNYGYGKRKSDTLKEKNKFEYWEVLKISKNYIKFKTKLKLPGNGYMIFFKRNNKFYICGYLKTNSIWGFLYWYSLYIFHIVIFKQMIKRLKRAK